jgi:hypothetical protein
VGGYVDEMWIRVDPQSGENRLEVRIHSRSLSANPSSDSAHIFEKGLFLPQPPKPIKILGKFHPPYFDGMADWDRDGKEDLIVLQFSSGDLYLYPGANSRDPSTAAPVKIGNGWLKITVFGISDWDGDGHQDIIARKDDTGDLYLYPGQSVRGYSQTQPIKIGNGWNGWSAIGVADWDGDGHQDIVTREKATGDLYLYPGESVRGYSQAQPVKIGNGWNPWTALGIADWDGDGNQDIIVRQDATGDLFLYPGESVRGYSQAQPVKIGNGWNGWTPYGVGDWDGDGKPDILVKEAKTADLYLYPGEGTRAYSQQARAKIGNGW